MAIWTPPALENFKGLQLTQEEKDSFYRNMPLPQDGKFIADAVFEGGGVRGTAFLGALRCFDEVGIQWRKVAGTSAGSITAALIASGLSTNQIEKAVGDLDYEKRILSQKSSRFIMNGSPADDLHNPQWMLMNLLATREQGQYSTEPFKAWLQEVFGKNFTTFADVQKVGDATKVPGRELKVVVSDISRGEMVVLPDDLEKLYGQKPEKMSVAEAVRLSMSIPLFFEPGKLGNSTIVDGGILSNFPLWIFDVNQDPNQLFRVPACPTFGFRLINAGSNNPQKIDSAIGVLTGMLNTMMVASDRRHIRQQGQGRVIEIPIRPNITATKFNLSNDDKDVMYLAGYSAAKRFIKNWRWSDHLKLRGFRLDDKGNVVGAFSSAPQPKIAA